MDVSKPQQHQDEHHQDIITDHNNCCLCGSQLQFRHFTDFLKLEVKEEAYCLTCQVRTKTSKATLQ